MNDLLVVIDLGKSLIKVIYYLPKLRQTQMLLLDTELAELSVEDVDKMKSAAAKPEDDAWLELDDGTGLALGFLASTRFRSRCDNKQTKLKYVTGAERCLAVIGAIAEKTGLGEKFSDYQQHSRVQPSYISGKEFSAVVCVLLPFGEFTNQERLQALLSNRLSNFRFRDNNYRIKSHELKIDIKPEGAGQLLLRQSQLSKEEFRSRNILCLIMGQYNLTAMLYQRGQRSKAESPASGFYQVVKDVVNATCLDESAIPSSRLIEAIYYGRSQPEKIRALVAGMVDSESDLNAEVEQIAKAIEIAKARYWGVISKWLKTWLAEDLATVDEVLISGGAATAFKAEVEKFFANAKVIWGGGINQEIRSAFGLKPQDSMVSRLVDAYGIYKWLRHVQESERASFELRRWS